MHIVYITPAGLISGMNVQLVLDSEGYSYQVLRRYPEDWNGYIGDHLIRVVTGSVEGLQEILSPLVEEGWVDGMEVDRGVLPSRRLVLSRGTDT